MLWHRGSQYCCCCSLHNASRFGMNIRGWIKIGRLSLRLAVTTSASSELPRGHEWIRWKERGTGEGGRGVGGAHSCCLHYLRAIIVISRTNDINKNLYNKIFSIIIFGPDYCSPVLVI